ncbi:beta-galactosidase [Halostagnicola sp. A-GB9-2]|uniref:beta-galactosidase n=1 Tax=Halostagnicola sp. A-GB9-2 TaxID=3048066 RepID=UPI0024BF4711|nr:beta-galactosidase [Halostagnicola sp. A-GB9-2]MDJ1433235.1 beta-galactosidase [Halostagnicola sp. A-GB9-2]
MTIGVCYFPEHWPDERWRTDIEQMAEAGIEYVRMAEFAWSRLEPERGEFDFEWLERALELIGEHDMQAVLCTPTATPPRWLVDEHPEILQEEPDGTTRHFGSRRHYCFNSPEYARETDRIVERMADHFSDHPVVAGWQTDNEFGCHGTVRCYCDDCSRAFSEWLRERYDDIETLNEEWGTTFWSQRYDAFEQIEPPRHTVTDHHPSLLLDFYRFSSDSVVDYNERQLDALKAENDDWFVTHNFMSHFGALDSYDVSERLEFASWDSYPTGHVQQQGEPSVDELLAGDPDVVGLDHDLYRSAANAPFWVMEQQPGDINWPPYSPQPAEGAMRLWAHHAVAHGADEVVYFRWRRCRQGQEQYHAGLRNADGTPARGYDDASAAASELEELPALSNVDAPVAIVHEYDNLWALDNQPHAPEFDYWSHLETYYRALRARGVSVDIVPPTRDLSSYDAVVAPTLHLVDENIADTLQSYTEDGGELLLTMRSGVKDRANKLLNEPAPGPLADIVGATVTEHGAPHPNMERVLEYDGETFEYTVWNERLELESATVKATYQGGGAPGTAAITQNEIGDGCVTYCGVWPESELADALISTVLDRAEIPSTDEALPTNVRAIERDGYTWVTNFSGEKITLDLPEHASIIQGDRRVPEYDLAVLDAPVSSIQVERK